MRFNDAVAGLALLVFGFAVTAHAQLTFPAMPGQDYGPALFPSLIGGGLALSGAILVGHGVRSRRPLVDVDAWVREPARRLDAALVLAALVAYILLADLLGFIITSTLLLTGLLIRLQGGRPLLSVGLALAATLVVWGLFANVLLVPLPLGPLAPVLY